MGRELGMSCKDPAGNMLRREDVLCAGMTQVTVKREFIDDGNNVSPGHFPDTENDSCRCPLVFAYNDGA